jgi:predicted ATPase
LAAHPISPQLFGRDAELAELEGWLDTAGADQGRVLLVGGEAGVGKSRLVDEALQMPVARSYAHLRAGCLEGDEAEPYALIRALVVAAGGSPADLSLMPAPEAERQVRQVQQALSPLLHQASGQDPLLVAVEDIHWSDAPSLQVLLALTLQADRVHFLLSYRPQPVTPGLAAFLADISRLRLASSISLQPLSAAATARMVRAMLNLQEMLPTALLDEVIAATEGIPFLVEELVHTLIQRGDLAPDGSGWRFRPGSALAVPASLRHSIEARLLLLPPAVVEVGEQAAVLGQELHLDRLARLSALDEPALFAAVRALIAAQILVRRPDGTVAFRHALTREALRTRPLPAERQALHRHVAHLLEEESEASAAMLAYHWSKAGDQRRAAAYALQAARRAAAINAHREALAHYEVALSGAAAPRVDILTALGDHHEALGEHEQAVARYEEAQALHHAAGRATE